MKVSRQQVRSFIVYGLLALGLLIFLFILASPRLAKYMHVPTHLQKADAIVLLCAGVYRPLNGEAYSLSLNSLQRSVWTMKLLRDGWAPRIIVSSGATPPSNVSESSAVIGFLKENGVRDDQIVVENRSFDTETNAIETLKLAEEKKYKRLLIVANAVQIKRALWLFEQNRRPGIEVIAAPTPPVEENYRFLAERMYLSGILFHEAVGSLLNLTLSTDARRSVNFFLRNLFN